MRMSVFDETKTLITSKTVWGGIILIGNYIARRMGYDIGDVSGWVDGIIHLTGAVLVVYGRVTAVKRIEGVI